MAFRGGRGRGRGRGGGFSYNATPQPFKLFPEDVQLPDKNKVPLDTDYFDWNKKLQLYFKNSPYFVEESATQDCQSHDIERYSDSLKPRNKMKRDALSDFMKLKPGYFPRELLKGVKTVSSQKKVKWDPTVDKHFFELLVKREKEKGEKETDSDNEVESDGEKDEGEFSDDGDYEQNQDFDDDEDDYNDKDDGDDEPFY